MNSIKLLLLLYVCLQVSCTHFNPAKIEFSEKRQKELVGIWFANGVTWTFHNNHKFESEIQNTTYNLRTGDWETSGDTLLILSYDVPSNSPEYSPNQYIIFYRYSVTGNKLRVSSIDGKYGSWELEYTR